MTKSQYLSKKTSINLEEIYCCVCGKRYKKNPIGTFSGYSIVACSNCKLKFVDPRPTKSSLSKLYTQKYYLGLEIPNSYENYESWTIQHKRDYYNKLKLIEKNSKIGKLFEIGCSNGYFLSLARTNGWQVNGMDISNYAINKARKKYSLKLSSGPAETMKIKKQAYNVVVMWDTIEHLTNPYLVLKNIHKLLKSNGRLFLSTGITDDLLDKVTIGYSIWYVPPNHLYFFSFKSLSNILRLSGFKVVSIFKSNVLSNPYIDTYSYYSTVAKQLISKIKPNSKPSALGYNLKRSNIGTIATVVAKKI